jgi:hypothetical protein
MRVKILSVTEEHMKKNDIIKWQKRVVAWVTESIVLFLLLLLVEMLPLPYLNYMVIFIAGMWIRHIHPNPFFAALILVSSVLGLSWAILLIIDPDFLYANLEAWIAVQKGALYYLIAIMGAIARSIFARYNEKGFR